MKQNCGEEWQGPVFHNDQTYKTAAESMGSQKRLMESTFCFQQQKLHIHTPHTHTTHTHHTHTHHTHNTHTPHTHTHTHTHERYVQNVTPGTENLVVHVTIIVENRTQKTVLNYCAQAKAVSKCVKNAGLSDEKFHRNGKETGFTLILCIHLRLDLQIYQQSLLCHTYFQSEHGKKLSNTLPTS